MVFLENVANLVKHDNGKTFLVIYNSLAQFGYCVKYMVMDTSEYGNIPQRRERIFLVGFLDYNKCSKFKFPDKIPLSKKINDIIDRSVKHSACYYYSENSFYYTELKNIVTDKSVIYKINDDGVCKKKYSICQTLTANMGTYPDRVPVLLDDFGIRRLTPKECLLLQGFPEDFCFGAGITLNAAYKQVGNSVCVPIINRIAEQIKILFQKDFNSQ